MRLACCVPFCTHTRGDRKGDPVAQYDVFICRDHWVTIPRQMRRAYQRKRFIWKQTGKEADGIVQWRLFKRLMRYATERAVGI